MVMLWILVQIFLSTNCEGLHTILSDQLQYLGPLHVNHGQWFKFICPQHFQEMSNLCVFEQSLFCPPLKNLEYSIEVIAMDDTILLYDKEYPPNLHCKYFVSEFLTSQVDSNNSSMELFYNTDSDNLFLEVNLEEPIDDVLKKIYCWGRSNDSLVPFSLTEDYLVSDYNTKNTRYELYLNDTYSNFNFLNLLCFCYLLYPGKLNPIVSNKVHPGAYSSHRTIYNLPSKYQCTFLDEGLALELRIEQYMHYHSPIKYLTYISIPSYEHSYELMDRDDWIRCHSANDSNEFYNNTSFLLENHIQHCPNGITNFITELAWSLTKIGLTVYSYDNPCTNNDGKIVTRKCEGDSIEVAKWSQVHSYCSNTSVLSNITEYLVNMVNVSLPAFSATFNEFKLNKFTAADIDLITSFLRYSMGTTEISIDDEQLVFEVINRILDVPYNVFEMSEQFNTPEKLLTTLDVALEFLSDGNEPSANYFNYSNLVSHILEIKRDFYEIISVEGVSVRISKTILEELKNHESNINPSMSVTIFNSSKLFSKASVLSKVAYIKFFGVNIHSKGTISIYLPADTTLNLRCVYWSRDKQREGKWSSFGIKTIKHISESIVECKTPHFFPTTVIYIPKGTSEKFCPVDRTSEGDADNEVKWCESRVGLTVYPCENVCVNNDGEILTRKCELNTENQPSWSELQDYCSRNRSLSSTTEFLINATTLPVSNEMLINLSGILNNTNLTGVDFDLVSRILHNAADQNNISVLKEAFCYTMNSVLDVDHTVFNNSKEFHTTEKLLKSFDMFILKISNSRTLNNQINVNFSNYALQILQMTNNISEQISLEGVSAIIPESLIHELKHNQTNHNLNIAITVFRNTKLFPGGLLVSDVVDVQLLGSTSYEGQFIEPISIFFNGPNFSNVECVYWNRSTYSVGSWSSFGIKTIVHKNSNTVECQTTHLTAFGLRIIPERILEKLSETHNLILGIITIVGYSFSFFGTFMILCTTFGFKNWYKKRINSILLAFIILLEVSVLLFHEQLRLPDGALCMSIGAISHYLLLAKLLQMIFIAKSQYENFVTVYESRNKQHKTSIVNILVTFFVPLVIVSIAVGVFPNNYRSGNLKFCFPKGEVLIYFTIMPTAVALLINTIVFTLVMIKITGSLTRGAKEKILQLKAAIMLWFMLDLTWLFGVLVDIVTLQWLQLVFLYAYCLFAPFQGLVVFIFTVGYDNDARKFWIEHLNYGKYRKVHMDSLTDKNSFNLLKSYTSDYK